MPAWLLLLSGTLVASCGGSGGSGGDANPPQPVGSTQVAMTTNNAVLVAALGNAFLESYAQLTLSALDNLFDLSDSGRLTTDMSCQSGSAGGTTTLLDNDGNGRISGFFLPSLTRAGSNRIAITNSDKILLLDPGEF